MKRFANRKPCASTGSDPSGRRPATGSDATPRTPAGGLHLAAAASLALLAVVVGSRRIASHDFWWQLATGRWVLEHGFPRTDVFSFVAGERAWIEPRWLYCVGLRMLVDAAGPAAAVLAKTGLFVATIAVGAAACIRRRTVAAALVAALLVILAASFRLAVRPEALSWLFLVLFVAVIHRERRRGGRATLALPLVQVAWTNTHTLFVLGPVVAGAWVATEAVALAGFGEPSRDRARRAVLVLLLVGLACLVNPWGLDGALFPLGLFEQLSETAYSTEIGELRSPFSVAVAGPSIPAYVALLALVAAALLLAHRRLDPFLTLLVAAFAFLSLRAVRNVPLFALVALPFLVHHAGRIRLGSGERSRRSCARAGRVAAFAVLFASAVASFLAATDRMIAAENHRFGVSVQDGRFPIAAADHLEERGVAGERVFCYLTEGSHLLYRGFSVYFDPRLEVYGEAHLEEYRRAGASVEAFERSYERYRFPLVVLATGSEKIAFARELAASGRWRFVWLDERAFVLAREGALPALEGMDLEADAARFESRFRRRLPPVERAPAWYERRRPAAPYARLGAALVELAAPGLAEPFLRDALVLDPRSFAALSGLGFIAHGRGDDAEAIDRFERAREVAPDEAARSAVEERLWVVRARASFERGDLDAAIESLERAAEISGDRSYGPRIEALRAEARRGAGDDG